MFGCLPPSGKCEGANLKEFAEQLSDSLGARYGLAKCLDVSDRTKPQPEVLLRSTGDKCVVIERKVIVWPPDYLKFLRSEREFCDSFLAKVNPSFQEVVC